MPVPGSQSHASVWKLAFVGVWTQIWAPCPGNEYSTSPLSGISDTGDWMCWHFHLPSVLTHAFETKSHQLIQSITFCNLITPVFEMADLVKASLFISRKITICVHITQQWNLWFRAVKSNIIVFVVIVVVVIHKEYSLFKIALCETSTN